MTFRMIGAAAALWTMAAAIPAAAQNYFSPEILLDSMLDQANVRRYFAWDVNGSLGAKMHVTASAASALTQTHGIRVCVCRTDASVVAYQYVMVGESKTLNFNLSTGRYMVFFDLGVADPNSSIGQVNFSSTGQLTNLVTGVPVRVRPPGDLPPDPAHPPDSNTVIPGTGGLTCADLIPQLCGPSMATMVILYEQRN